MRRPSILIVCGVFCVALIGGAAARPDGYFPDRLWRQSTICTQPAGMKLTLMTDDRADWYWRALAGMNEPSLADGSGPDSWRFLWLRSFHAPIAVRIQSAADGRLNLTAKRLSGQGGYDPGLIAATVQRPLEPDEARRFRALAGSPRFDADGPPDCTFGADGARWIIETRVGGQYHFQDEWTPQTGEVAALGRFMLDLTDWDVEPIY